MAIVFIAILLFLLLFHFRKKAVIQKINAFTKVEKKAILDTLAKPGGYVYDPEQDIFATRADAPQKHFGYTTFYDLAAPYFNMVFDYETFYFDYDNKTWLFEMWKGQYGINTGCEFGIYYADEVLTPDQYDTALFHAVNENDMLPISLQLNKHCKKRYCPTRSLGYLRRKHWWLTIFDMGTFAKPKDLFVNTSLQFKNRTMMYRFLSVFQETLPDTPYEINGFTVNFTFDKSMRKYSLLKKFIRHTALFFCSVYCKWFHFVTRPFTDSGDKLLYLYYYLPFTVRFLLKQLL